RRRRRPARRRRAVELGRPPHLHVAVRRVAALPPPQPAGRLPRRELLLPRLLRAVRAPGRELPRGRREPRARHRARPAARSLNHEDETMITDQQARFYADNGYLVVENLFDRDRVGRAL